MLVAEDARAQAGLAEVCVAMDARMDEIYAGRYAWRGECWTATQAPALMSLEAFNAQLREAPARAVAGSALAAFGERLALAGGTLRIPEPRSRAEALARLAAQLWAQGVAVDAAQALPVYLRDKVAQTTAEREHDKALKAKAAA
jgi:tRNA threonylcarbamoyladenosine biosynthesis protein TsaB